MTGSSCGWIREYFDVSSCDLTPANLRRDVRFLFVPTMRDARRAAQFSTILSEAEQVRACSFRKVEDQVNYLQRRAFRRYCGARAIGISRSLSQIQFAETDKGRPHLRELPDTWFSFSASTNGFLAAWSSSHAVGVDIEDPRQEVESVEIANYHFAKAEAAFVSEAAPHARRKIFHRLWTLKEAALKSIGEGMPYGLDAFRFELAPAVRVAHAPADYGGSDEFRVHMIENEDACAAIALRRRATLGTTRRQRLDL